MHSYEACTSLCTSTADCVAVTYYSKYYGSTNINSGVTSDLAADGSSGTGGMLCIMKKQTTGQGIMKNNLHKEVLQKKRRAFVFFNESFLRWSKLRKYRTIPRSCIWRTMYNCNHRWNRGWFKILLSQWSGALSAPIGHCVFFPRF